MFSRISLSTEEKAIDIVDEDGSASRIRAYATTVFTDVLYEPTIAPLDEVKSLQQETHHNHLEHDLLDSYFANDAEMSSVFF